MKKLNNIKAIIFDLGETLTTQTINTQKQEEIIANAISNLFVKKGYSITTQYYLKLKNEIWNDWKEKVRRSSVEFPLEDFLDYLLERINILPEDKSSLILDITEIIYNRDLEYTILKPNVAETLQILQDEGYLLGIISNSSYSYNHILRILEKLKIKDYFKVILVSSREGIAKPDIRIFKKALCNLGVQSNESIFIGDSPEVDVPDTNAVEMKVFLIANEELNMDKTHVTGIIKNPADILPLLLSRRKKDILKKRSIQQRGV